MIREEQNGKERADYRKQQSDFCQQVQNNFANKRRIKSPAKKKVIVLSGGTTGLAKWKLLRYFLMTAFNM
ncbi:MAG: hypothetical protein MI975_09370 [Cytophagales bacterium]|nr:hypothetical protein [Cytophagales bacterium]